MGLETQCTGELPLIVSDWFILELDTCSPDHLRVGYTRTQGGRELRCLDPQAGAQPMPEWFWGLLAQDLVVPGATAVQGMHPHFAQEV